MQELLAVLQHYYVDGRHEGRCLVAGEEWQLQACPFPMRSFEEYSLTPPAGPEWQLAAARRALLEEKPDLLLTAACEPMWEALAPLVERLGLCWLRCRSGAAPADWQAAIRPRQAPRLEPLPQLSAPDAPLSRSADPVARLRELLQGHSRVQFREPVNLAFEGGQQRFRYGHYDNEFALQAADHDLRQVLASQLKPEQFRVTVSRHRPGTAGDGPCLECPDHDIPFFQVEVDLAGLPAYDWSDRFRDGLEAEMRVLLIDLYNVAGSGMQHAMAINLYSKSTAHVLCKEPHPFIEPAAPECNVVYTQGGWSDEILQLLKQADVLGFFEEDDVETLDWPESFKQIARTKASLHFYVGQRVHSGVAARQRPDKTVLIALCHVLRMYPGSHFYHGFYPPILERLTLRPPLSARDGILRVLHTPSLPHPTLHRYLYHKDTSSFLDAAQVLKERYPQVQFLQLAGVPHSKILQARLDCDICFHQLRGFPGMTGNEAMFLGRATIQGTDQENFNRHLEQWGLDTHLPWVIADRTNLVEVTERLITDPDHRAQVGQECRQFMLDYFNARVGIQVYLHYALRALTHND